MLALNIVSIDVVNSLYINLFLTALQKAQANYEEKQTSSRIPEKTLFKLAWEVNELGSLIQEGRRLVVELDVRAKKVQDGELNRTEENIARQLTSVCKDLVAFVQTLSKHQRNPATHIFVFMISPESQGHMHFPSSASQFLASRIHKSETWLIRSSRKCQSGT